MKTLLLATAAILTLGSGIAVANTPAAQMALQQVRPANEAPAYLNREYPAPDGGLLAQQQTRPESELPAIQNRQYAVPDGALLALQQTRVLSEPTADQNRLYPAPQGG